MCGRHRRASRDKFAMACGPFGQTAADITSVIAPYSALLIAKRCARLLFVDRQTRAPRSRLRRQSPTVLSCRALDLRAFNS
jgi:hypothetical protein